MARRDAWLGWVETARCVVMRASSGKGSDPYDYFVAAGSRQEAVELLRPYGMHGFRFRTESNTGVDGRAVEACLRNPGVVLRQHVDERCASPGVAPPPSA